MPSDYNIFAEFLNPESRRIHGFYTNMSDEAHREFLSEVTRAAVFLCHEYCMMTASSLIEDKLAQDLFNGPLEPFLAERLVRVPLRDGTWREYLNRHRATYEPFRKDYPTLYEEPNGAEPLLSKYASVLVERTYSTTDALVRTFEERSGADWDYLERAAGLEKAVAISLIPRRLRELGQAVVWPAVASQMDALDLTLQFTVRRILQRTYCEIYANQYELTFLDGVPYRAEPVVRGGHGLCCNYDALHRALSALGVWDVLMEAPAELLVDMRNNFGYPQFREMFARLCGDLDLGRVKPLFAGAAHEVDDGYRGSPELDACARAFRSGDPVDPGFFRETVGSRLGQSSQAILARVDSLVTH